jgi:hypothetical protein
MLIFSFKTRQCIFRKKKKKKKGKEAPEETNLGVHFIFAPWNHKLTNTDPEKKRREKHGGHAS